MASIKWSNELSVGVPLIDEQHKTLIQIANGLINAVAKGSGPRVIKNVVRRLREYTVFHFNSEEELMRDVHYLKRGEHSREHRRLKEQVKRYQRVLYERKDLKAEDVANFLKLWLLKHILEMDMELARHVREKDTNG